jgi:hypothetical protein
LSKISSGARQRQYSANWHGMRRLNAPNRLGSMKRAPVIHPPD